MKKLGEIKYVCFVLDRLVSVTDVLSIDCDSKQDLHASRSQELIDKQRKALETSIQKMQSVAVKGEVKIGAIASRQKKLTRLGMEKNIHGHKFKAQHEVTAGRNSIRAGSMNGITAVFNVESIT